MTWLFGYAVFRQVVRVTKTTAEQSHASRIAVARPMPRLAPVTIATDWFICERP